MNYLAFVGWGFYGASSARERANLYASWGLDADLPPNVPSSTIRNLVVRFWSIFRR